MAERLRHMERLRNIPDPFYVNYYLRDMQPELVNAWNLAFALCPYVNESHGDIFRGAPAADAIVSPANSFGTMRGGIDGAYSQHFGQQLEKRLEAHIRRKYDGELLVGQAAIIPVVDGDRKHVRPGCNQGRPILYLIAAPTMRVTSNISQTANAFLAFRAVILAVREHNRSAANQPIRSVLCPGLGTAIGQMPIPRCSYQMLEAYRLFELMHRPISAPVPLLTGVADVDHQRLVRFVPNAYPPVTAGMTAQSHQARLNNIMRGLRKPPVGHIVHTDSQILASGAVGSCTPPFLPYQFGPQSVPSTVTYYLRDEHAGMVTEWNRQFNNTWPNHINISHGDPRDIVADAIVNPTNGIGFTEDGISGKYCGLFSMAPTYQFQKYIQNQFEGELLVGQAILFNLIPDDSPNWQLRRKPYKFMISAPVQRVSENVSDTANAFLAFRAIIQAVNNYNRHMQAHQGHGPPITTVVCPALLSDPFGHGQMRHDRCAYQMVEAFRLFALGCDPTEPYWNFPRTESDIQSNRNQHYRMTSFPPPRGTAR